MYNAGTCSKVASETPNLAGRVQFFLPVRNDKPCTNVKEIESLFWDGANEVITVLEYGICCGCLNLQASFTNNSGGLSSYCYGYKIKGAS